LREGIENVSHSLYRNFVAANPWQVKFEDMAMDVVEGYVERFPMVLGVLEKVVSKLETFPPDPSFFLDPRPSLHDMRIWLTVSEGNLRFVLKVEYRLDSKICFIVDFRSKSQMG
jgi:hypothetical protein